MSYSLDGYPIGRALQPEFSLLSRDSGLGPIRPKRRQVKNACTRCQKACKKCDDARPCLRCVRYGCTDACVSSVRKERKKGFKRGPYKKRDAEAQLLLSRVPSLRATRKSTDHPHQAGPPTTVSAFTNSPLAEQPNPPWDTGTDYHPHPAYHTVAAAAGAADGEAPYPAAPQYLTSPPAHHPQVEQYHGQFYFQLPPQVPSHHPQHLIAPAVPSSSQYYLGSMGHKHTVTGPLSYHVHHQYHA